MKIRFIGTGAADFSPLLKNELKNQLDQDARRSCSALVDEHILIDCGPHTLESLLLQDIDLGQIDVLLLTHLHGDHYQAQIVKELAQAAERTLSVYVHRGACKMFREDFYGENVEIIPISYCKKKKLVCGVTVTGLPANHTRFPVHYLIEDNGKSLYYATDGAWIMYDAFYYLKNKKLDMLVLDATVGDYEGDLRVAEHNSIPMIRLMLKSFETCRVCDEHTKVVLTHLARTLNLNHADTADLMAKDHIEVAYDGLVLEL